MSRMRAVFWEVSLLVKLNHTQLFVYGILTTSTTFGTYRFL